MASTSGRKTSSSPKRSGKKSTSSRKTGNYSNRKKADAYRAEQDRELFHEIGLIILFVAMVVLFCCNFGLIGPVGDAVSKFMFGLFGLTAYIAPILIFVGVAFWSANEGSPTALRKIIAGAVLFLMLGIVCDLIAGHGAALEKYDIKAIYEASGSGKSGGGVLAGSLTYLLHSYLETIGTVLVVLLCSAISLILLTEKSLINSVKSGSSLMRERTREDAEKRREYAALRRQEQEEIRARRAQEQEEARSRKAKERRQRAIDKEQERSLRMEERENERILRMDKKVSGVMLDTTLARQAEGGPVEDIHEIIWSDEENTQAQETQSGYGETWEQPAPALDFEEVQIRSVHRTGNEEKQEAVFESEPPQAKTDLEADSWQQIRIHKEGLDEGAARNVQKPEEPARERENGSLQTENGSLQTEKARPPVMQSNRAVPREYVFPPLSRLQKGKGVSGDSTRELKETAMRLQQTLQTFGVRVTITDISQGPSVTRYELQPEQGVKVSKIVNLADDIKLNLAATDIRIEAPIPGKAAIGIEVPNKENMTVALRDLLESKEFQEFPSKLSFAVGKDIGGKTVVADIAKMPHMLIAGSTGSGKSVCINTLIMSILYKAHPDDVKLIMVDPKVVELSVYNGIPHLLIPVVTDPKKASAALHWGVTEMEDRYRKFADYNVRDLKGYNQKVEAQRESGDETAPAKMPQIVIIVDELADLMMVCPGEVEESICRLAQLARAAGIHLIIATQRPSVDVITGLIKANMPSRVAFAVSSGVDSRTILDMNGAEKLLGKGDMLFYPQGYPKPARIQGAFVSDKEVSDVVDFLKNQALGNTYAEDIEEKIKNIGTSSSSGASGGSERDEYFEEAGRFIIDKDKASIGMLQRVLKIGFNRAARIMDQLCEYGVVGEEEGTKPRKVLMSMEQFEQLLEEI